MRNALPVGRENHKGFTGQGEHHLPPSDVSHLIPCQLSGHNITRPTVVYVRPGRLGSAIDKFKRLGQVLAYPQFAQEDVDLYRESLLEADNQPAPVPVPAKPRKATAKPLICLCDGKFYGSTYDAADAYGMHAPSIYAHLVKGAPHAKGYRFRYATEQEITRHDANPAGWVFDEPLLPNLKPKKD
jgi:hypothetical protein